MVHQLQSFTLRFRPLFCSLVVLTFVLLLTSCTLTLSPFEGVSLGTEQGSGAEAMPQEAIAPNAPAANNPVERESNISITDTFGWGMLGKDQNNRSITLQLQIDEVLVGRQFDNEFYDPNTGAGQLVARIQELGFDVDDVKLESAVVYNVDPDEVPEEMKLNQNWTLYYRELPAEIISVTHVFAYSTIAQGVPYVITQTVALRNESGSPEDDCDRTLATGVKCLQEMVGSSNLSLLERPAVFLLLSTNSGDEPYHILVWFTIPPNGDMQGAPGGGDSVCNYCTKVCDGSGWCGWVCPLVSC